MERGVDRLYIYPRRQDTPSILYLLGYPPTLGTGVSTPFPSGKNINPLLLHGRALFCISRLSLSFFSFFSILFLLLLSSFLFYFFPPRRITFVPFLRYTLDSLRKNGNTFSPRSPSRPDRTKVPNDVLAALYLPRISRSIKRMEEEKKKTRAVAPDNFRFAMYKNVTRDK